MNLVIRKEIEQDKQSIYSVNQKAFRQPDEADLVDRIRPSEQFVNELSLVAEIDDKIVGHILFSKITIECDDGCMECLGLAPMSVLPDYQNQGIGSRLVQEGLEKCKEMNFGLVIVLGHPHFYPKFGFIPASQMGITVQFDSEVPDEAFMVYECIPGTWTHKSGVVKYPSAFDDVV